MVATVQIVRKTGASGAITVTDITVSIHGQTLMTGTVQAI